MEVALAVDWSRYDKCEAELEASEQADQLAYTQSIATEAKKIKLDEANVLPIRGTLAGKHAWQCFLDINQGGVGAVNMVAFAYQYADNEEFAKIKAAKTDFELACYHRRNKTR